MVVKRAVMMAKLTPLATSTTELTLLVPLPHGRRHPLEGVPELQGFPGPREASYPADVAKDWNNVMEYPRSFPRQNSPSLECDLEYTYPRVLRPAEDIQLIPYT